MVVCNSDCARTRWFYDVNLVQTHQHSATTALAAPNKGAAQRQGNFLQTKL